MEPSHPEKLLAWRQENDLQPGEQLKKWSKRMLVLKQRTNKKSIYEELERRFNWLGFLGRKMRMELLCTTDR